MNNSLQPLEKIGIVERHAMADKGFNSSCPGKAYLSLFGIQHANW